ncbi:DnaB-like helicase C-terminal domain-containing protein [Nocardioides sp. Root151]|uniref:DnaB-like helicase C-terminal domain-containing protein n=1 Tax=Nocardioides sp. Root151 TaxID=1736475 RepID=UPI000702F998|nr:DnaB-like helicase C-terminal domain-containing protein [Nocardioides sp. Root151]KQZ70791.1 hypothetical protein ASD66_14585 [Nocardioides sp. Root151]
MLIAEHLLAAYDAERPSAKVAPSGFTELDSLTGGMVPGRVWLLLGVPGEGRTTLMTQWAAAVAGEPGQTVHLVTPREAPWVIVSRLLSLTGLLPLDRLNEGSLDDSHQGKLGRAREKVQALSLCLYAQGEDVYVPEVHPGHAAMKPTAVLIDDADRVAGLTPTSLAAYAAAGLFVLISLPRHHVIGEDGDLDSTWARVADVVLEVRHRGLPTGDQRPGEADLHIHNNRWGPTRTIPTLYQAHFSRFVDSAS